MGGHLKACSTCGYLSYVPAMGKSATHEPCPNCNSGRLNPLPDYSAKATSSLRRSPPAHVVRKATHKLVEIDRDLSGSIYVYLEKEEYVSTWVNGGTGVPIRLASEYRDNELKENKTPDENIVHESNVDLGSLRAVGIDLGGNIRNVSFSNNMGANGPIEDFNIRSARHHLEDGLVMCFSRTNSRKTADFLKRKFCVRIDDIPNLKNILDKHASAESIAGKCQYTDDFQRNPFLKHSNQAFMDEFRIYWPNLVDKRTFNLPPGVGVQVKILDSDTGLSK